MALKKTIISKAGYPMEYWRIGEFQIFTAQQCMIITLVPYISAEIRNEGYPYIEDEKRYIRINDAFDASTTNYTDHFTPSALELSGQSIYTVMYTFITDHVEEFLGSESI